MSIYILLALIIFYLSQSDVNNKRNTKIAFLLLLLLAILRNENVGTDLHNYISAFNDNGIEETNFEFGYIYFTEFLKIISLNNQFFILATSIITLIPIYWICVKLQNTVKGAYIFLIYLLFDFYLFSFSGIRQSIAISFFLISIYYLSINDYKKCISLYIVAISFHISVIFYIPIILFTYFFNFNKRICLFLLTCSIMFSLLGISFLSYIINNIDLSSLNLLKKYEVYNTTMKGDEFNFYGLIFFLLPQTLIAYLLLLIQPKKISNLYFKIFFASICLMNIFATYPLILRIFKYGSAAIIISIPMIVNQRTKIKGLKVAWVIIILLTTIYVKTLFDRNNFGIINKSPSSVPYKFYWE